MKNNKTLILCLLLVSSLVGCGTKTSSNNEGVSSSSVVNSSSSKIEESTKISSSITSNTTSSSSTSSVNSSTSSSTNSENSSTSTSVNSSTSTSAEVILEDLNEKIELGIENLNKVKSGTLTYNEGSDAVSTYEFGVDKYGDFIHINEKEKTDKYYGYNANKEVYGIQISNDTIRVPLGTIKEECIDGPFISPFGYGEQDKMFGVKGVMQEFLNLITENKNKDFINMSTESEGYKFSFGKVVQDYKPFLWISTVSFSLEDNTFKNIDCTFKKYSSITADFENDGVYYLNPNAKATQTITAKYEQVIGERDAVNPHDIESYYISSFDIKDENGNLIEDSVTMNVGTPKELKIENILPTTANSAIDSITVSEATGNVTGTYKASTGVLTLNSSVDGDYEVLLSTKKGTKTINVHVNKAAPTSVTILYYIECGNEYIVDLLYDDKKTISTYVGSDIYIRPSFSPNKADQSNILEVTSENKDKLIVEETQINNSGINNNLVDVYRFNASEAGVYNVTISSASNPSIKMDFEFEAKENPSFEDVLKDRYVRNSKGNIYVDVNFEPSEENKKVGKVTVNDINGNSKDNCTYNYTYNENTKEFELVKLDENGNELSDEVNIQLEFNVNYDLVFTNTKSSQVLDVFSHALMISKIDWNGRDTGGGFTTMRLNEDGTGTFGYHKSDENFETIASFNCEIQFEIKEVDEELQLIINEKSLEKVYKSGIISNVGVAIINPSYKTIELTLTVYDVEETITFVQGG